MLIVPPGILCYMNMCSSEYMNILYTWVDGKAGDDSSTDGLCGSCLDRS